MNEEQIQQILDLLKGENGVQMLALGMRAMDEELNAAKTIAGQPIELPARSGSHHALLYRPKGLEGPADRRPVFFDIHGGGFVMGTPEMDDEFCQRVCDELGIVVISLSYRLAPEYCYPADKDDVFDQIEHVRAHAEDFGIDTDRMAIGGHSAGGNISTSLCLRYKRLGQGPFRCAILDYPPVDLATDAHDKPLPEGCIHPDIAAAFDAAYRTDEERFEAEVSPLYASADELAGLPPHVFVTASGDTLCAEAEEYAKHLMAAGVEVLGRRFYGVAHGFTMPGQTMPISDEETTARATEEAIALMIRGLKAYLVED